MAHGVAVESLQIVYDRHQVDKCLAGVVGQGEVGDTPYHQQGEANVDCAFHLSNKELRTEHDEQTNEE